MYLTQAGQSENLTDQSDSHPSPTAEVKASSAKANAPTKDVATGFPSKLYSPAVGDVVEILDSATVNTIGNTEKVEIVDTDRTVKLSDGHWYHFSYLKLISAQPTFTGSYSEKQEQWIKFHGLKVGSKVKVVRKWKADEDGSYVADWDYNDKKIRLQGKVIEIKEIKPRGINTKDFSFPYFALEPVQ